MLNLLLVGICLVAIASSAYSAPVVWSFEDDDVDAVLRYENQAYVVITSGIIQIDDIFLSVMEVPDFFIGGKNAIPAGMELTGVSVVQYKGKLSGTDNMVFDYYSGFNAILSQYGYIGSAMPTGAAIAMFMNGATLPGTSTDPDLFDFNLDVNKASSLATNCNSVKECVYQATLGEVIQIDGFKRDPDEYWIADPNDAFSGAFDIGAVLNSASDNNVATVNLALSNFYNSVMPVLFKNINTGVVCPGAGLAADGCVQVKGSGDILGGEALNNGLSNGFIAHSDFQASKTVVPEPSTLILMGLGLGFLGVVARRKK